MSVTIKEIAELAGVSQATVSLVLNDRPGVGQDTRDKVFSIASRVGYEQRRVKQASARTRAIRFLRIVKHGHIINTHHRIFIADYIDGLEKEAKTQNYRLELLTIEGFDQAEILRSIDPESAEGVIVLGTELDEADMEVFKAAPLPVVFIDTMHPYLDIDCVDMNNESSVYAVVEHFVEAGHRRIGIVKGSIETKNFNLRERSFLDTTTRLGVKVDQRNCFVIDSTFEKGREDMTRHLSTVHDLPTALFCVNDIIAYGCIQALKDSGRSVPQDISIIGFDNLPSDDVLNPPLTSIKVSKQTIGHRAMRLMLEKIADPTRPCEKILIGGELIVRSSVRDIS
jgi:DNA-binding LacI/PurR family transcriptional regulator